MLIVAASLGLLIGGSLGVLALSLLIVGGRDHGRSEKALEWARRDAERTRSTASHLPMR